jgi:hypothetical protein
MGLLKKRPNPKTRQNRDNTYENDKKEGYQIMRGIVYGELNSLRIVAYAKDDC